MSETILEITIHQDSTLRLDLITTVVSGPNELYTIRQAVCVQTLTGTRREFLDTPMRSDAGLNEGLVATFPSEHDAIRVATALHQQFVDRCQTDHDFTSYLIRWGLEALEEP
jgi:hypothetical protein